MPVAIRKRSWEEQYSYDDLHLVCCHELDRKGSRVTAGPKQGRRTRCASMPEQCHHESSEVKGQTAEVAAPVDHIEVYCGLREESKESVHADIFETACVRTEELETDQNSGISTTNIGCVTDSGRPTETMALGDGESEQDYNLGNNKNVCKGSNACEEPQCITIHSNNECSLCAGDGPGISPNHEETKEGHTAGHSIAPQISDPTTTTADLPHVRDGHLSSRLDVAPVHAKATDSSVLMENGCVSPHSNQTVEAVVMREQQCDKGLSQISRKDCAERRDGPFNPGGHLIENKDNSLKSIQAGEGECQETSETLAETVNSELANQMLLEQRAGIMDRPNEDKSEECTNESIEPVYCDILTSGGDDVNVTVFKQYSEEKIIQESVQCADEQWSNSNISSIEKTVVDQAASHSEKSISKLDTIPEATLAEPDAHQRFNLTALEVLPNGPTAEKQTQETQMSSAQVNDEVAPTDCHGNRASSRPRCDTPAEEVADGPREQHTPVHAASGDTNKTEQVLEGEARVKVRVKKHEQVRLDSMILLLMKLDQLDQEIENALSATSSIRSTPTLLRHQVHHKSLKTHFSLSYSTKQCLFCMVWFHGHQHVFFFLLPEIEAKEACTWLRAAGFPQYAQLYEDAQFPIDICSVTRDHDFLDRDAIEALCRRLNTLNKCALMRLEISPQRKRSEDSDEDEPCAISGRWTFQRDSKRWSRMDELDVFSSLHTADTLPPFPKDQVSQKSKMLLREGNSSESVLTDLSEQPEVGSIHSSGSGCRVEDKSHMTTLSEPVPTGATRASSVASMCSSSGTGSGCANEDSLSDGMPPSPLETLGHFTFDVKTSMAGRGGSLDRGSNKSTRSRAKSFLKRMESLRLRSGSTSKRKKKSTPSGAKIEISGPVIKEGLDDDKLRRLNCVDISSINLNLNHRNPTQTMTLNRNRTVSYSTQTSNGSTGSTGSSQSEASSGSAVSTPSPVTRARSHSTAAGSGKRGGMYLEGFDPLSVYQQASERQPTPPPKSAPPVPCHTSSEMTVDEQNRRNNCTVPDHSPNVEEEEEDDGMIFFYLPEGHKPGTFPKALHDSTSRNNNNKNENGNSVILRGRQSRRQRRGSSGSVDSSRLSFYDNVPYTEDAEEEDKLEEVLQDVSGLQRFVNDWSEAVAGEEDEEEEDEEEDSDSALDSASPCPSSPLQNRLEETENGSDQDSTGNPLGEGEEVMRERRDSGVGASLTRTSRPQKLRWPSFQNSHRPSVASAQLQISCQSVLQMNLLQKLSLLQLTALLEKHTPTNKHGFSWAVPKFMKRIKVRDYKDRNVFGVPLQVIVQRTGQPLPQGIQQAMRYLRNHCLDQVGLFRKSGVKSRIQALRQMNEASGADGGGVNYEGQSAYDVADMLKQYFRDLPEPLLTSKLSETFLQIYQYMPKELRLQAARAAVLLLPDENREALRSLLCFLSDVTANVSENQMTPTNLAVCLAPSLFHLNTLRRKESSSPRVMNRKQNLGKPDQRDLNENLAATHGLTHMIQECRKLFRIPEEMNRCRNSYVEQALLPRRLEELTSEEAGPEGGYRAFLRDSLDTLLKEAKDKFRGYDSCSTPEHAELAYRKVHDVFPLRLWKVTVEIPATPEEVLTRILREQSHWDEDLLESRVLETLDDKIEVYQYVRNTMAPHPTRDHVIIRTWATDLAKGACALVCSSVDHEGLPVVGVRVNVLTSRYFIEPCGSNKSRLTHLSRIDCRGRFPEWYNKLYGHLCAAEVARIRDSFTVPMDK
ncbi:hypothetical protein NQD34_000871 [Periophthalmus magnuspinnatus]|nr:hypothetical protein NQD34_000871 [Periophthalmus magnuspinnatus]